MQLKVLDVVHMILRYACRCMCVSHNIKNKTSKTKNLCKKVPNYIVCYTIKGNHPVGASIKLSIHNNYKTSMNKYYANTLV